MTPDWVIVTLWFVAGITATGGFWYFLDSKNVAGAIGSVCITVAAVAVAILLRLRNDRLHRLGSGSLPARLLAFIWSYPLTGENEASWAVKESTALRGDLGTARENPALGVAIVTTELALAAFGDVANSRIDLCVSWGVGHAQRHPPYQMLAANREPIHDEKVVKVDFRHTLAFAVILARTRKQRDYLLSHVRLALARQCEDGGWPSDSVMTISPVFTAFYGIELLHLASADSSIPVEISNAIPAARENALKWLMNQSGSDGLWSSSVFRDFAWDRVFTAAWVLHRLAQTANVAVDGWRQCLDDAAFVMIQQALDSQSWLGASEAQRHRVEARIAAAASRAQLIPGLSSRSVDSLQLYLGSWVERAKHWLARLPADELDVGTAAFLVDAMVPTERLRELGRRVRKAEESGNRAKSSP